MGLNAARWRIMPALQRAALAYGMTLDMETVEIHKNSYQTLEKPAFVLMPRFAARETPQNRRNGLITAR
jgi:hypothetical protein